jgi:hypothetical protein
VTTSGGSSYTYNKKAKVLEGTVFPPFLLPSSFQQQKQQTATSYEELTKKIDADFEQRLQKMEEFEIARSDALLSALNFFKSALSNVSEKLVEISDVQRQSQDFMFRMMYNSSHSNFSSSTTPSTNQMMMMSNYHVQLPTTNLTATLTTTFLRCPLHLLHPLLVIIIIVLHHH